MSPVEVENVLLKHPGVADTAVVGVKDARTGNELPRYVNTFLLSISYVN